jgi:hypothetical protein
VELGISVTTDSQYRSTNLHEIKIGKYAETFQFSIQHTKYNLRNKSNEEKTLIIEHPRQYQYDLYETSDPDEETESYYRYKVNLPPMTTETFEIKLRRIEKRRLTLNQIAKKDIEKWFKLKLISEPQRDFLLKIYDLEMQKREIEQEINKTTQNIKHIIEDQQRLRENLKSLGDSQSEGRLKEKYVTKLEQQEETLEQFKQKIEDLNKKKKEIEELIKTAMVERKF